MNRTKQLEAYYNFEPAILDAVTEAAALQNRFSFRELADQYGIGNGPTNVFAPGASNPIEVLTLRAPGKNYDESKARVYHTAFAYPVNDNTAMHALRLFAADPSEQLVVVGNPSAIWTPQAKLSTKEIVNVALHKTLRPTVLPILSYLEHEGVTETSHMGFSYGADKAATAIAFSSEYMQKVDQGVMIEPVSVVKRGLVTELLRQFAASGKLQQQYVKQTESRPYDEIWAQNSLSGFVAWASGFARLSNLAIGRVLADSGFLQRAIAALENQPDVRITVGWGTQSELCPDHTLQAVADSLSSQFGENRARAMRIEGMHHAGVDDIDLHAAVMLQGLKTAKV